MEHQEALQALARVNEDQRKAIRKAQTGGKSLPRAYRGSHSRNAEAFKNAEDVRNLLRANPGMTVNAAVRRVAESRANQTNQGSVPSSRQVADQRFRVVEGLARTIERHYYAVEKSRDVQGLPSLEAILDD